MCESHLRCLSKVIPRYLISSEKSRVSPFSIIGFILYLVLRVENTITLVLIVFNLTPLSLHQEFIILKYLLTISRIVTLRSDPCTSIARSSANACTKSSSMLSFFKRVFSVRFHKSGDRMPPWGHPLYMCLEIETP